MAADRSFEKCLAAGRLAFAECLSRDGYSAHPELSRERGTAAKHDGHIQYLPWTTSGLTQFTNLRFVKALAKMGCEILQAERLESNIGWIQ